MLVGSTFEGYVFYAGQPLAEQEVRLEIYAHEYVIVYTDAAGRFSVELPAEECEFAIRVVRNEEAEGDLHSQAFTSIRDVHILQIAVIGEVPYVPAPPGDTNNDNGQPGDTPSAPESGIIDLPSLFNSGNITLLVLGGVLLFVAGLFCGLGVYKLKN